MSVDDGLNATLRLLDAHPTTLPVIAGATASGKTELAIRLAERISGEIIGVDSVQVVRKFNIGSGKPTREELARAPHHLIDLVDPLEAIDAASFAVHANRVLGEIRARGRVPILVGGTFLWHRAVLFGLAPAPPADASLRAQHRALVETHGRDVLHALLRDVDPESAQRLHPNDVVRVSRALEVHSLTGEKLSDFQARHGFQSARYAHAIVALRHSPEELTQRIESRAKLWLASGWIEEVEGLLGEGYGSARAMNSVGYSEVRDFLQGKMSRQDLSPAVVRATRVFARRQRTWLNHQAVLWL